MQQQRKRDHKKIQNNHKDTKLLKPTKATERDENTKRHITSRNVSQQALNIKRLHDDGTRPFFVFHRVVVVLTSLRSLCVSLWLCCAPLCLFTELYKHLLHTEALCRGPLTSRPPGPVLKGPVR